MALPQPLHPGRHVLAAIVDELVGGAEAFAAGPR